MHMGGASLCATAHDHLFRWLSALSQVGQLSLSVHAIQPWVEIYIWHNSVNAISLAGLPCGDSTAALMAHAHFFLTPVDTCMLLRIYLSSQR